MNATATVLAPALAELDLLIGTLAVLRDLPPLERARTAAGLDKRMRATLAHVGDEATFEAAQELVGPDRRRRTQKAVAECLGVSVDRINKRVQAYRTWLGSVCDAP